MGVSPRFPYTVKSIFENNLWESAEIARVYAGFSPVRRYGIFLFLQRLVVHHAAHNYILCFRSQFRQFPLRHILECGSLAAAFTARPHL
jgi:hypothetical protein